jgi:molybdate transport system ATP-binding protein
MVAVGQTLGASMLAVDIEKSFRSPGSPAFQLQIKDDFPPGFTIVFGPSGAGKSTLLDCIAGLLPPDHGKIQLADEIFFDTGQHIFVAPQKRRIGYVFQSLALFPHLSVKGNVAFGLSGVTAAARSERVEQVLETFHILPLQNRKPSELSGGEKQRVALARSVITQPRVLLLDEPLTGLDAGLRQAILNDLRNWSAANPIPILYVTHNREEVNAIGDRVVAIVDGHVRAKGTPQLVLDAPRVLALAQAAGFENVLAARVVELRPNDGVMRVGLDGSECELEIPLGAAQPGESIQVAIRAGDIMLATQLLYGLSARNILPGTVESIETRGTLVRLQVNAGVHFIVHVTPGAMRSLELDTGSVVWLIIKTHSCHVVSPQ